jgi:hypothetical protein
MNPVTMRARELWGSNSTENARVTEAVVAACRQLEGLELEILEDAELSGRLAAIEASVLMPTEGVPTPLKPAMTPYEERVRGWREEEMGARP